MDTAELPDDPSTSCAVTQLALDHLKSHGVPERLLGEVREALSKGEPAYKRPRRETGCGDPKSQLTKMYEYCLHHSFEVSVCSMSGDRERFEVQACTTVEELKGFIERRTGKPSRSLSLFKAMTELDSRRTFVRNGVGPLNAELTLVHVERPCLARLVSVQGPLSGKSWDVPSLPCWIGRAPSCTISLRQEEGCQMFSGKHLCIEKVRPGAKQFLIRVAGYKGVVVNGIRFHAGQTYRLAEGDVFGRDRGEGNKFKLELP
mmetsp:Transcript_126306/g.327890  ORF Transcript_126306/g.327890 Transcript_126306/m.327890 type:complete len:260 (+) Transcript_126306:105-884(+)